MPRATLSPTTPVTFAKLARAIEKQRKDIVKLEAGLTACNAVGPQNDGPGEAEKAKFLTGWLKENGFPAPKDYPAADKRVKGGKRPNLVCAIPGASKRKLWVFSHLDVVPPGERSLWTTDPFTVVEKGGKIFGRGVEDNQQGMVSSIFAAKALLEADVTPKDTICLSFVADEETGSDYGIKHMLAKHKSLFAKDDLILVPDAGDRTGTKIEIAEKGMLWLRFTVEGKQCHASMPYLGKNAMRAGSDLAVRLDQLYQLFPASDELFDPKMSTFEPTKREANVPNINTLPGFDVFCLDSRVLPPYPLDDVIAKVRALANDVERTHGVKIAIDTVHREDAAPPTSAQAPVVRELAAAIEEVDGVKATPFGIGGGTVAALFRKAGFPAAVWSKQDESAHSPNEYAIVDNLVHDAKVYCRMMTPNE